MKLDRREFIKHASGAAGLGLIGAFIPGGRSAGAARAFDGRATAASRALGFRELEALAMQAIDDARGAGARFADVRVDVRRFLRIEVLNNGRTVLPTASHSATLGLRAAVDGAWGGAGGSDLTPEGVRETARLAVARARTGRSRRGNPKFGLAPAATVRDGAWETPIKIDPFEVPVREHEALILDALPEAARLRGAKGVIRSAGASTMWLASQRVFASTEGSLISQRTFTASPSVGVWAVPVDDHTRSLRLGVPTVRSGAYGYEAIADANLKEELPRTCEEALRIVSIPVRSVDVGRYDLVLSAEVVAHVLADTVGRALELDRALGEKAVDEGTTYAMPPDAVLGSYRLGSERLTVTADRSRPGGGATIGWDEEGVAPEDFVLVEDGIVVDYITTRRTAPVLASWYESRGEAVRSHGCAVRRGNTDQPSQPALRLPNLTIQPGAAGVGVEELIRDVQRGFYIVSDGGSSVDHQRMNTQVTVDLAYEIRDGKLGGLVRDMAFQFSTPRFWQSLEALGGTESASVETLPLAGFQFIGVESVPALFRRVNVFNTSKQA